MTAAPDSDSEPGLFDSLPESRPGGEGGGRRAADPAERPGRRRSPGGEGRAERPNATPGSEDRSRAGSRADAGSRTGLGSPTEADPASPPAAAKKKRAVRKKAAKRRVVRAAPESELAFQSPAPAPASAPRPAPPPGPRIVGVGELTRALGARLKEFGRVAVEGEITGLKRAGSGHVYFGLKDPDAYLNCAIWRSRVPSAAPFPLKEGQRVVCHGDLDVYAPRGSYSLMVSKVEQRGIGELLARLEEIKVEWRAAGRFDRRRPLPPMPRLIGIVTSRDTAAFQDFLRTRSLRWPLYPVRLAHTPVQGREAAREIAAAIERLDASGVDVIVVARGGGSLEDLWCFNELPVAEAIWRASVPVVSGVGHETDVTLADHVADWRAHTPTDAAQAVIPDRRALVERLERAGAYLLEAANRGLERREERLERLARSRVLQDADWILGDRAARVARAGEALRRAVEWRVERTERRLEGAARTLERSSPQVVLEGFERRLAPLGPRLEAAGTRALDGRAARLELAARSLRAISPFAVLQRGYSITRRVGGGAPLESTAGLAPGERLETVLAHGRLLSTLDELRAGEVEDGTVGERGEPGTAGLDERLGDARASEQTEGSTE